MKKIVSFVLALFVTFGLFANPLTKVSENEWTKTEETGYSVQYEKNGVIMYHFSQVGRHYITLKDDEMHLAFEGDFATVKAVEFDLLHNRLPDVAWTEVKNNEPTKRKLVKRTIAKADAEDTATGKREGVHTAASRASEAKDDWVWEE